MRNSTLGGRKRRHRRQFPVRVRYCTSPQVLQRITSRSRSMSTATLFPFVPFIAFVLFCSDTGAPRRLFRHADERDFVRGEGSSWRERHNGGIRFRCQVVSPYLLIKSVKSGNPLAGISIQDYREGGLLT